MNRFLDEKIISNWNLLFLCWLIAAASIAGSLFFSEVMEFAPCSLCWYQRICLFPLLFIFLTGLFPFDSNVVKYALPLTSTGCLIALYQNLLYYKIIPESLKPCTQGVSCSEGYIDLFGFLTIPMLALIGFSILTALLLILKRRISL
ncbi:MAG: disulfide bond formation protein B [Proteobacteria bacterium]|nr:disulfide bond formation protein B [Desulfobulbaceae bacterium]MBU4152586.1 disulfide bond formation protein B [Pseudomonadota bacterium]